MNERLRELRNYLDLSQEEFGDKLGIKSRAHISLLENGTRNLTDRVINDMCREFSVNEDWLRNGQGEMFVETKESFLSGLAVQYDLDNLDMALLESYISLTVKDRGVIKKYVHSVFETLNDEIATTVDEVLEESQSIVEGEESYIERELAAYRLELEAEKKGQISSVSENIS